MTVVDVPRGGEIQRIVTFLTAEEISERNGIPPRAVVGVESPDGQTAINTLFREFLHAAIAENAPTLPELLAAAEQAGDGRLVFLDDRAPEVGDPAPEDILGWFAVRQGRIVPGSYLPNPHHAIEGRHGWTSAIEALRPCLLAALQDPG